MVDSEVTLELAVCEVELEAIYDDVVVDNETEPEVAAEEPATAK